MKRSFHIQLFYFFILQIFISCNSKNETIKTLPNIIIAISDDQSFAHTSIFGDKLIHTPSFDKVASNGILFTNCIAASPGCAPSRSALLTGRYPWQNEQAGQHASDYPLKYVTFPLLLEKAGYKIGKTGKGCAPFNWKGSGWKHDPAGPAWNNIKYQNDSDDAPLTTGISRINYFENFKHFISDKKKNQPFYFWYGATEPHRAFEKYSGAKLGKNIQLANIPAFLPNHDEIKNDLADYAIEIEWFDKHLGKIIDYLDEIGELENTIIIVTSDNGMAFPRAKANGYEYGIHVPLAIWSPKFIQGNRTIDELISFTDFAPTILEFCGVDKNGMLPITGKSLTTLLTNKNSVKLKNRDYVFSSRERHSSSRWNNVGYPIRSIRTDQYLLIRNFKPERWPAGAPQMINTTDKLLPMHGIINASGMYDFAYTDIDACPSKDLLIQMRDKMDIKNYFNMAVDKRPEIELFDVKHDPACIKNLANEPEFNEIKTDLILKMEKFLIQTKDPRFVGDNPDIFETYKRYSPIREFPEPDWIN